MPVIEFTIETTTGAMDMHVTGVAGKACDDVTNIVKKLVGAATTERATAEYTQRARATVQAGH